MIRENAQYVNTVSNISKILLLPAYRKSCQVTLPKSPIQYPSNICFYLDNEETHDFLQEAKNSQ